MPKLKAWKCKFKNGKDGISSKVGWCYSTKLRQNIRS